MGNIPRFIYYLYDSIGMSRFSSGSGVPTLNRNDVHAFSSPIAQSLAEQQKIAECLNSLDELIGAERQKIEALKIHKNWLTRQLFPVEGEFLPGLRFPEFRNAPGWEETGLGQIVDFESGGTPSKQNPRFWNGLIPWVSAKDMKLLFLDDTEDHITTAAADDGAKQVPAGAVLMLTRGMTLFKNVPICVVRRPMSFNQDVKALRSKGDLEQQFLPYLLLANKQRLLGMVDSAGHGTGRLDTDELKSLIVMHPQGPTTGTSCARPTQPRCQSSTPWSPIRPSATAGMPTRRWGRMSASRTTALRPSQPPISPFFCTAFTS
jgi:type I restriction enzyme S subunit